MKYLVLLLVLGVAFLWWSAQRKNARRAIVSINVEPGDEQSREPPNNILKQLAKAHAQYFSVALQKGDLRNNARGMVVDGLTEAMGGRHDAIVGQSALVGILKQYAELINAQYEMQYSRPMGVNPQVLQIATRRPAGTVKGFRYSQAMKNSGKVWTEDNLRLYIHQPQKIVPNIRMTFRGLQSQTDVENVLAYLKTLKK